VRGREWRKSKANGKIIEEGELEIRRAEVIEGGELFGPNGERAQFPRR